MKKRVTGPQISKVTASGLSVTNSSVAQAQEPIYQVQPPSALNDVARRLAKDPKYQPSDGETKCNIFLSDFVLQVFNYSGFVDKGTVISADAIVDLIRTGRDNWKPLSDWKRPYLPSDVKDLQTSFEHAVELSNRGFLIIYGLHLSPHGHVAVGVTGGPLQSPKWTASGLPEDVPKVAQAGETVFAAAGLSKGIGPANFKSGEFVIYVRMNN